MFMSQPTVILTGGSSGIGLALARAFDDAGYTVCNLDLHAGAVGEFYECDVTDYGLVHAHISAICDTHNVTTLVANAGVHHSATIEETSPDTLQQLFDINVKGAYAAIQAVLPRMKAQRDGAIIVIASEQAVVGKRHSFAYNMTKHALASMVKTTALDYAPFNIRANAICPGTTETPLYHRAIDRYCEQSGRDKADVHAEEAACQPLNRLAQPEEVASYALYLASPQASFITGALQLMDGGYTAQ
jgi:NAD(P)-dependent dehydrogenase (short-subunit alcohol dehydrogenase family)